MSKVDLGPIKKKLKNLPHMTLEQGKRITDVIVENGFENILELGFRHGVSTCYMAAALKTLGQGHVTTIDLLEVSKERPNIEELLQATDLKSWVTVHYEPTSYLWRLMKILEENPQPIFDFCYIDGAHDWCTDGFAFFLVDKLLKPGGMIVFDDLDWTFKSSPSLGGTERVRKMPLEEKSLPQIRKVYDLLVKTHPSYCDFLEMEGWAYARKVETVTHLIASLPQKEIIYRTRKVGLGSAVLAIAQAVASRFEGRS